MVLDLDTLVLTMAEETAEDLLVIMQVIRVPHHNMKSKAQGELKRTEERLDSQLVEDRQGQQELLVKVVMAEKMVAGAEAVVMLVEVEEVAVVIMVAVVQALIAMIIAELLVVVVVLDLPQEEQAHREFARAMDW